jgi:hypothetical protein
MTGLFVLLIPLPVYCKLQFPKPHRLIKFIHLLSYLHQRKLLKTYTVKLIIGVSFIGIPCSWENDDLEKRLAALKSA